MLVIFDPRRWSRFGLCGLLALGAAACTASLKSPDGGPDASFQSLPDPALDPLQACLLLAKAAATLEVHCQRLASADFNGYVAAQCPAALFGPRELAFDAGLFAYSLDRVQSAVASLQPPPNGTIYCNQGSPVIDPSFLPLGWGVLGAGQACDDPMACGSNLYCQRSLESQPCGLCTEDVPLASPCGPAANGAQCAEGGCTGGTCRFLAQEAGQCALSGALCVLPLACGGSGTCLLPGDVGTSCPNGDPNCLDQGDGGEPLGCQAFGSLCEPSPQVGQDCTEQGCAPGLACQALLDGGNVCAAFNLQTGGGPCIPTDGGPSCLEFETCRDGGCVPRSPLGGGCGQTNDCSLGGCVAGVCQLQPAGASCARDLDCAVLRCDVAAGVCGAACQ